MSSEVDFEVLRSTVEANVRAPGVIAICSAAAGDGKSLTAFGLAATLKQVGHRAILLDANLAHPGAVLPPRHAGLRYDDLADCVFTDPVTGADVISLSSVERGTSPSSKQLRQLLETLRQHHDFVVVDTDRIPESRAALQLASLADGVIISCRLGRMPTADDQLTIRALESCRAKILGVVPASRKYIDRFAVRLRVTTMSPERPAIIRESATVESVENVMPQRVARTST
jgi:Mrp family chromosome partitioning ATPase